MIRRQKPQTRHSLHKKSRAIQRWNLSHPWIRPILVLSFASIRIQSLVRGYLIRKRSIRNIANKHELKGFRSGDISTKKHADNAGDSSLLDRYLMSLDNNNIKGAIHTPGLSVEFHDPIGGNTKMSNGLLNGGYTIWCIIRIQSWTRMLKCRRRYRYQKSTICQIASITIQLWFRMKYIEQRRSKRMEEIGRVNKIPINTAVTCIQLAWRSYNNKRIYRYYKDLIMHKLQGVPSDILRTLIPNECDLLDKASGAIVRFRLGGGVFPPSIYFKIFTRRGICDVNSFAPRVYSDEKPDAYNNLKHNYIPNHPKFLLKNLKVGASYFGIKVVTNTSVDQWYQREENNEWRPLLFQFNDTLLSVPSHDNKPNQRKDCTKSKRFHFDKHKRRDLKIEGIKRRRREWFKKAYLLAGYELYGASHQFENADQIDSESDIDLLKWSQNLNFDDYKVNWNQTACSKTFEDMC